MFRLHLYRLVLAVSLLLPFGLGSEGVPSKAATLRGMTLLVDPATISLGLTSTVRIRLIDVQAVAIVGALITVSGATMLPAHLQTATLPIQLKVRPAAASQQLLVTARLEGFAPVSAQLAVRTPPVPARVAALAPGMGIQAEGVTLTRAAKVGNPLYFGWQARTGATQRGSLRFADGSVLSLDHDTEVLIENPARTFLETGQVFVQVVSGGLAHDLETGGAIAATIGTRYVMQTRNGVTSATVLSGRLALRNAGHAVSLGANQRSIVQSGSPPGPPGAARAADLIQWASGLPEVVGAASPGLAFVLQQGGHALATLSLDGLRVSAIQTLPQQATGLGLSRDGHTLLVATINGVLVQPLNGGPAHQVGAGLDAAGIATLPTGEVAVADRATQSVRLLDANSGVQRASIAIGYSPVGIAASPDGHFAVVDGSGEASLLDLQTGRTLTTTAVPGVPGRPSFAPDGTIGFVPVPAAGELQELSVASRGPIGSIDLSPPGPASPMLLPASVTSADGRVFVADATTNAVMVVDPIGQRVLARYPLGAHPQGIALGPDGKLVITADRPPELIAMDPLDGFVLARIGLSSVGLPMAVSRVSRFAAPADLPSGVTLYSAAIGSSVPSVEAIPTGAATPSSVTTPTPAAVRPTPSPLTASPTATDAGATPTASVDGVLNTPIATVPSLTPSEVPSTMPAPTASPTSTLVSGY